MFLNARAVPWNRLISPLDLVNEINIVRFRSKQLTNCTQIQSIESVFELDLALT